MIEGEEHRKSLAGWGADGEALARECAEWSAGRGHRGVPSSPAACYRSEARKLGLSRTRPLWSANVILAAHFHGGWQEVIREGFVKGPLAYYDLKSAYRWAASLPMPDPTSYRPYREGDEKFVGLLDVAEKRLRNIPAPFDDWRVIVTHEDPDAYKLRGRIVYGVSWSRETTGESERVFDSMARTGCPPEAVKRAARGFWGAWAQLEPVDCELWQGGRIVNRWSLPPAATDIPAAAVVVHRVIRRVWQAARAGGAVLTATDAILTSRKLETGPNVGDWQVKDVAPDGVFVIAPGVWGKVPLGADLSEWLRSSGIVRHSGAFLDMAAINALRERRLLGEAEMQRALERIRSGEEASRVAESARVREILTGPDNPYRTRKLA